MTEKINDYKKAIEAITELFEKKQIKTLDDSIEMAKNQCELLIALFDESKEEDKRWSVRYAIVHLLPLLEKMLSSPKVDKENAQRIYGIYRRTYAFCGRRSLQHFTIFMEWDRPSDNMVYVNRQEVLEPIMYYLNKALFDDKLKCVGISLAPGMGKSFSLNYYTAWSLGVDINGSILRLSYSEELLNGFSRAIKDLIASDLYAEVFPVFYEYRNKPFEKEKDSDWKIKNADVMTSHYVRTRDGATTGVRAKKSIIFDDMTKGAEEAYNDDVHENYWKKYLTEWWNRRENDSVKYIFAGTMWNPKDLLNRIKEKESTISPLIPSKKYKYVWECEDGHAVFINIPLLDENDKSTCERVMSTKEALQLRDITDPYLFSCVYQQNPIAPSGLEFAYENLRQYRDIPRNEQGELITNTYAFAVLDPTRKGKDNISMPICVATKDGEEHYVIDWLYKKVAMTEAYDEVINKIVENNIVSLFVENNTDTSLKTVLDMKMKERGITTCIIDEKYNVAKKEVRIKDMRGLVLRKMLFKAKGTVSPNSDYGRAMSAFTTYSFDYANKNDDAPDSLALYVSEIIIGHNKKNEIKSVSRSVLGF